MLRSLPQRLPFDRVASIYDGTRGLAPRTLARVLGVLVDELGGKRVLEVGVGTGRYAVPLQKSGIAVVGIDISRRMVELGLAKGLREVVFADGAHIPFRDGAFDAATTNHVLHLVPDWRDVLGEIARVTRDVYFSILEDGDRWPVKREYDRKVREGGYVWNAPGLPERELPERLVPDVVMPVGPFHEAVAADALLDEIDGRTYSSQWDVPGPLHRRVVDELREAWGGRQLSRSYSMAVTFWRVERLRELARSGQTP
jgi:SAM-dependent methyltransferase